MFRWMIGTIGYIDLRHAISADPFTNHPTGFVGIAGDFFIIYIVAFEIVPGPIIADKFTSSIPTDCVGITGDFFNICIEAPFFVACIVGGPFVVACIVGGPFVAIVAVIGFIVRPFFIGFFSILVLTDPVSVGIKALFIIVIVVLFLVFIVVAFFLAVGIVC